MCLMLIATAKAAEREKLEQAARQASASGLRIEREHLPRWPWAGERPARATISEKDGCACSLLSDDADWHADFWAMRPEILERLATTLQVLIDEGPTHLTFEALWNGESALETVRVTEAELVQLARTSRLGTRSTYKLHTEGKH
jgi:hypothetical protein